MLIVVPCHGCWSSPDPTEVELGLGSVTMTFEGLPQTADADGASETNLRVTVVGGDGKPMRGPVRVGTTRGRLEGAGTSENSVLLSLDAAGQVEARLIAPSDSSVAVLTAAYGSVVRRETVLFRRARPEWVVLDAQKFSLGAEVGGFFELSARVGRSVGRVGEDPGIEWSLRPDVLGRAGATWDAPGSQATIKLVRGDSVPPGPVTVRVAVPDVGLVDSIIVWLRPPQ